jgi:uncharacterized protein YciI
MSLFVLIGRDGPDGKRLRPEVRPDHLAHLEPLARAGRIVLAGRFTDGGGSLVVFEAESLEEAKAIAERDPYVRRGVFASWEVRPFQRVLP